MALLHEHPREWIERIRRWLWAAEGPVRLAWLRRPVRLAVFTGEGVARHDLMAQAAALAFWVLLYLVPFLALSFVMLRAFGLLEAVRPFLLRQVAAGQRDLVALLAGYAESARAGALGTTGLLALVAVGFTVLQRVKRGLNLIWHVADTPHYGRRLIEYLAVLAVSPFLLALPVGASALLNSEALIRALEGWAWLTRARAALLDASGFLVYWLLLFYAYTFLPDTRVRWRHALLGAVAAGTVLQLGQRGYVDLVFQVTRYDVVYGALALLPFLMLWVFLGALVFLLGAQLSHASQNLPVLLGARRLAEAPEAGHAHLGLRLLLELHAAFAERGGPVRLRELARRQELPPGVAAALAERLHGAGWMVPLQDTAERWVPARPAHAGTVYQVLRSLGALPVFDDRTGPRRPAPDPLEALLRRANGALERPLAETTLAALLEARGVVRAATPEAAGRA